MTGVAAMCASLRDDILPDTEAGSGYGPALDTQAASLELGWGLPVPARRRHSVHATVPRAGPCAALTTREDSIGFSPQLRAAIPRR